MTKRPTQTRVAEVTASRADSEAVEEILDVGAKGNLPVPARVELVKEQAISARMDQSFIDMLAQMEQAEQILDRRSRMLESLRTRAIRKTNPSDWVLNKDRDGRALATPSAPACEKIAEEYGIDLEEIGPRNSANGRFEPDRVERPDGSFSLEAWCAAVSKTTHRYVPLITAARASDEQFTGRDISDGSKNLSDLKSSVLTLLRSKAARVISGLVRVPPAILDDAWKGTDKTTEQCTLGHGYGKGGDRAAQRVAEEGVPELAQDLWDEIMRRTSGDEDEARTVLKRITSKPKTDRSKGFAGFDSHKRFTQEWQIKQAKESLAKDKEYGDE
jgi:hypothetical protein